VTLPEADRFIPTPNPTLARGANHVSHIFPIAVILAIVVLGVKLTVAVAAPPDPTALDKAFETLKTYDWGQDRSALQVLDEALAATHGDAAARKNLETRLVAVLKTDAPRAAKDVACRHLSLIGSADAVPALADLLTNKRAFPDGPLRAGTYPGPCSLGGVAGCLVENGRPAESGVINSLGVSGTRRAPLP